MYFKKFENQKFQKVWYGKYSCQKTTINTIAKLTNICYTRSTPK